MDKEAEPQTLIAKLGGIFGMAVSADGRVVAAVGRNGRVHLWKWGQWDTPMEIIPEGHEAWIKLPNPWACLALSADGELLAVALAEERNDHRSIRLYNKIGRAHV